jgi:iron complex transport system ATP-binding protein
MDLLSTQDLTIGYRQAKKEKVLQRDLNLSVSAGKIVSLMGQNGVGKTTLIKTITQLIPMISGQIRLAGDPIESLGRIEVARRMSVVLTQKPANLNLTVYELLALGRHPYSNWMGMLSLKDKNRIDEALSQTRTNYLVQSRLYELSDGQLQKVMIARALVQETPLIILDEPIAHLDLNNKIEIMTLLRSLSKQGKGILISTHDLNFSAQLSDEVWLFNFNSGVIKGMPEELMLNGAFRKALYLEDLDYDLEEGRVRFPPELNSVSVMGEEPFRFWTSHALSRIGFRLEDNAPVLVKCTADHWSVQKSKDESVFQDLGAVLQHLKE